MARRGALVVTVAVLLLWAAPSPPTALHTLVTPARAATLTEPLVAAVSVLAWVLAAWVLLTVLLTAGSRVRGPVGTICSVTLRRAAPAALRRAVALALGVGVVLGTPGLARAEPVPAPVAAATATSPGAAAGPSAAVAMPGAATAASAAAAIAGMPGAAAAAVPGAAGPGSPLDWPMGAPPGSSRTPAVPAPSGGPARAGEVVVERGDSLWRLAAEHLPPDAPNAQIATSWPSWWSANRQVIGDDPGLLHPGQHLVVPAAGTSAPD